MKIKVVLYIFVGLVFGYSCSCPDETVLVEVPESFRSFADSLEAHGSMIFTSEVEDTLELRLVGASGWTLNDFEAVIGKDCEDKKLFSENLRSLQYSVLYKDTTDRIEFTLSGDSNNNFGFYWRRTEKLFFFLDGFGPNDNGFNLSCHFAGVKSRNFQISEIEINGITYLDVINSEECNFIMSLSKGLVQWRYNGNVYTRI